MSEYRKLREYMNAHNINEETAICREIVQQVNRVRVCKKNPSEIYKEDIRNYLF